MIKNFLNPEGHQNCITGSKVTAILVEGYILPIGGVALGRVCLCSLRSRLVSGSFEANSLLAADIYFSFWSVRLVSCEESSPNFLDLVQEAHDICMHFV